MISRLKEFLTVPADKPDLTMAQMAAFSRQIPLLYTVLLANMLFVSATHYQIAPPALTLGLPTVFGCLAMVRIVGWWKARHQSYSPAQAYNRLKSTVRLCGIFGLILTAWSMALLPYGDTFQQGHVVYFMTATLVACVFCLMHLRAAAILLTMLVSIPFCVLLASQGGAVPLAIALNMVLMAVAMMYVLSKHHDDFATMVEQRTHLMRINEETRRLSDENLKLARQDALTSLPNRRSFIAAIGEKIDCAKATGSCFAVGLIDLDGFKAVNDLYGHAAGDALLIEASHRLKSLATENLTFARLGGDEFGFVTTDVSELDALADTVCTTLAQPYGYEGVVLNVAASCGVSRHTADSAGAAELLEFADFALYKAKEHNAGKAVFFTASHRDQLHLSRQIDQALRASDLASEMQLHYQPIISLSTGQVVGLEALARWTNKTLGSVAPMQFIAAAERSGMIQKLTIVLLQRLLADMASLPPHLRVSFNLSAKCIAAPECMLQLLSIVQRSGIDARRLEFEITETALVSNFDAALRSLQLLRNMGASIALDDFGTGYSSLSYVHHLPLDKIKIDRAFVTNMGKDAKASKIVQTIIGLSQDLKITCVAEGVETEQQMRDLKAAGCDLVQGYFYAKPMSPAAVTAYLEKHDTLPTQELVA